MVEIAHTLLNFIFFVGVIVVGITVSFLLMSTYEDYRNNKD